MLALPEGEGLSSLARGETLGLGLCIRGDFRLLADLAPPFFGELSGNFPWPDASLFVFMIEVFVIDLSLRIYQAEDIGRGVMNCVSGLGERICIIVSTDLCKRVT
jgi:hypothetical protein